MVINYLNSDTQFVYANSNRIFVYISNGGDGNIAVMKLNPETGDLTMVEKVPAASKCNAYGSKSRSSFSLCLCSFRTFFSNFIFN